MHRIFINLYSEYAFLLESDRLTEEDKKYIKSMFNAATLVAKGIGEERIRKYGFAFEGKKVLIG